MDHQLKKQFLPLLLTLILLFSLPSLTYSDPEQNEKKQEMVNLDELGGFYTRFDTNKSLTGKKPFVKGEYTISINYNGDMLAVTAVTVNDYDRDEYIWEICENKKAYRKNEAFDPLITGFFRSGKPMTGQKMEYELSSYPAQNTILTNGPFRNYCFGIDDYFMSPKTPKPASGEQVFGDDGTYRLKIELFPFKSPI